MMSLWYMNLPNPALRTSRANQNGARSLAPIPIGPRQLTLQQRVPNARTLLPGVQVSEAEFVYHSDIMTSQSDRLTGSEFVNKAAASKRHKTPKPDASWLYSRKI